MEAVASTELDDAIFPQPPQDVATTESGPEVENKELSIRVSEVKCDGDFNENSQEKWVDEKDASEEVVNEDEEKKSDKKKDGSKKKSRIRRLFTGIRLKKSEESGTSSEETETESELTLDSREASATALEEGALVNKTAFTRIIHRVQTKANRMWEQIGQKLGGRADSEDEMTEESSKSLNLSMSDVKQGGDAPDGTKTDCKEELPSEEVRKELDLDGNGSLQDLSAEDSKGKSGTLRRIASGLKSGLKKQKNKG